MDLSHYERAKHLLSAQEFALVRCVYDARSFGSWRIEAIKDGFSCRLIWDGRDSLLISQKRALTGEWVDQLIGDRPFSLEGVIKAFDNGLEKPKAAR